MARKRDRPNDCERLGQAAEASGAGPMGHSWKWVALSRDKPADGNEAGSEKGTLGVSLSHGDRPGDSTASRLHGIGHMYTSTRLSSRTAPRNWASRIASV